MDAENLPTVIPIFFGGMILSLGCTLVGIYAVKGSFLPVLFGYSLFVLGYELSRTKITDLNQNFWDFVDSLEYIKLTFGILGLFSVSIGTLEASNMVLNGFRIYYLFSSFLVFIGYMLVHKSVNEVIV